MEKFIAENISIIYVSAFIFAFIALLISIVFRIGKSAIFFKKFYFRRSISENVKHLDKKEMERFIEELKYPLWMSNFFNYILMILAIIFLVAIILIAIEILKKT